MTELSDQPEAPCSLAGLPPFQAIVLIKYIGFGTDAHFPLFTVGFIAVLLPLTYIQWVRKVFRPP